MRGHTAANGKDTLRSLHTGYIFGRGLKTDKDNLFASCFPRFRIFCGENDLAASGSRRSAETLSNRGCLFDGSRVELRVKERVKITRVDHENGFLLGSHTLVNEVARDLKSRLSGSLTVSGLEHEEFAVLNGEFHVLHISVMLFENVAYFDEFLVCLRELLFHFGNVHRGADACNNVFALSVGQEFAEKPLVAGCGVAGKRNAGSAIVAHVTECHRLNVNGGSPGVRDVVVSSVNVRSGVVPRTEYRFDRAHELFFRIVGEIVADLGFVFGFELMCKIFKVVRAEFNVLRNSLFSLHLVDEFFKIFLSDFHNDVGVHLYKSSVTVPSPSGVVGLLRDNFNDLLVKTEVQDRVHHSGHRCSRAGTHGNEKRIFEIAELFAGYGFHLRDVFHDLSLNFGIDNLSVLVILSACLGGNGESLRNGKPEIGHFGEVRALTAEKFSHISVAFGKKINIFFTHLVYTS